MLAALFRSNRPAVLMGVPVVVFAVFGSSLGDPAPPGTEAMPLAEIAQRLLGSASWSTGLVGMLITSVIAIQLAGLSNNAELLGRRNHLPALLFPLLLAVLGRGGALDPLINGGALLGMPLVILALDRTQSIADKGRSLGALFDAGVLLGIAAMFYLPYVFLVVVVWATTSVIRPFQWREYVIPVLGCALVFYMAWALLLLAGNDAWDPLRTVVQRSDRSPLVHRAWWIALNAWMIPMVVVAFGGFVASYQHGVMRDKNLQSSFMAFFTGCGVIMGLSWFLVKDFPAVLLAAPMAIFLGHALIGTRRQLLSEGATYVLLGLALWAQWA